MTIYHKLTLSLFATAVVVFFAPGAKAASIDEKAKVTFSGPVEVPGEVLPAGTYVLESMDLGHITRILSADETRVYATVFTVPEEQINPVDKTTIQLKESPEGTPERVAAWFYPGSSIGNEFVYSKASSGKSVASVIEDSGRAIGHAAKHLFS